MTSMKLSSHPEANMKHQGLIKLNCSGDVTVVNFSGEITVERFQVLMDN